MRRILAIAIIVAGCGGGASSATPSVAPAATSQAQGIAALACPAAFLADCTAAVVAAASSGLPAAVCVWLDGKWAVTTPSKGDTPGSACGTDTLGTVRAIIVAP